MADALATPSRSSTWSVVLSILLIVAGALAIALPFFASVAVSAVVGWLLVFSGMLHLAFAWRAGGARSVIWQILIGVVYGAIGIYIIARPLVGLASLTLALAAYLLVEAILEFVLSFELRPARGAGWLLFDGIVTIVLSGMIWATWPSSSSWVLGTLVGVSMFFSGVSRLMVSLAAHRPASAS